MTKAELKEQRKRLIQDMALKFVDEWKKKMRNEQTTREDDIASAFAFGFSSAIKGAKAITDDLRTYNRNKIETESTSDYMKSVYEMILFQIEQLYDEFDNMDYIQTNEENENLN